MDKSTPEAWPAAGLFFLRQGSGSGETSHYAHCKSAMNFCRNRTKNRLYISFRLAIIAPSFKILSALLFPLVGFILPSYDLFFTLIIIALALIIILRHRDNMVRIKKKQENLIPWGLNISQQKPNNKK